ncbi:MAG: c-type cytochrome [Planctomycetes bacterium]|nr:c-type cytochrome [Planctomycetota bacterium]
MRLLAIALLLFGGLQGRRGPIPPDEALKTFRVPPGFRVELVAAEPQVVSPVAMAFDEQGRLYVAEMRDYPNGTPSGTIRLLEDTDGDGRMDKSTLFAENVAFPSGLLCWDGGLFVTCAYEVLYLRDTDGDGKADDRKRIFGGFGRQNAQHVVNGLQFGIDNWIYGSNGLSGGTINGLSLNRSDFRFRPDTREIEPVSGNSQFGNTFDDWGRRFIVRHDSHLIHPVLPRRAAVRQPHLAIPAVEEAISDHGNIPKLHPVSPRDSVFTTDTDSSCAVTIYRGGAFPDEYSGNAFVCEPVMNLVHRDVLVPKGASFTAKRAEADREFFASTDAWSRPVNLSVGPDGALYVCDMYRAVIEHPDYIPKTIQPKLDMEAGKGCGRIYRIVSESAPPQKRPRIGDEKAGALVAHLQSPNAWERTTAQRLILERQTPGAAGPLHGLARDKKSPVTRLHALWTLEGLGELTLDDVARALEDPDPGIREHAIRLAEPKFENARLLRRRVLDLADDPDPRVRFQVALTLGEIRNEEILPVLLQMTLKDAADPWIRTALLTSGAGTPVEWLAALKKHAPEFLEKPASGALELMKALAQVVAAERKEGRAAAWLREAGGGERPRAWQREALSALIGRPEGVKVVVEKLENGQIRPVELDAFHRSELLRHPDAAVRNRAKPLVASKGSEEREELIREITAKMAGLKGDRARGEKVYQTNCATCHRLAGQGKKVGPDLEGVIGRDRAALMVDMLDPNRAMDPSYQVYVVRTTSNEIVNGVLASETPAGVTLRRAGGEESTILRRDIAELKAWPASLMPEGIENNVKAQDFADLLEFLSRPPGK